MEKEKQMKSYFTSESVAPGHPDKVADQISDSMLDALLEQDPTSRCAAETTVESNLCRVFGEVTTKAHIDEERIIRNKIREIGYTDPTLGFSDESKIEVRLHNQSADIALSVDKDGASDQGMMFGYATNETSSFMPLALEKARSLIIALDNYRKTKKGSYLRPDGKSQVTILYENGKAKNIDTIVLSAQHSEEIAIEDLRKDLKENLILATIDNSLITDETKFYINPTGRFVLGGPAADTGLTGRKIIVDTYGGYAHHGGGAFSGKDGTKVDRSASYMARKIAKTIVSSGLFNTCEIQLSYAIGVEEPVSIHVETDRKDYSEESLVAFIRSSFDLTPNGIINALSLRSPIFAGTARYGHFGFPSFPWEKVDMGTVEKLRKTIK